MRQLQLFSLAALLGLAGIGLGLNAAQEPDLAPTGKGIGTLDHPPMPEQAKGTPGGGNAKNQAGFGDKTGNGITYHGGPVMTNSIHVYFLWYGNWSNNTATTLLPYLASNIGASPYFRINTSYNNSANTPVSTNVSFGGATSVTNYPYGTSLSDSQIRQLVINAMNARALPMDADGVYFVLTSADVTASSGFCSSYCGWHTYFTAYVNGSNKAFKYSFIGDATRCLGACSVQSVSPNGNPGADAMASILAHELEEAATDPQLNAWYDNQGYENADKCAWTFGGTYTAPNGSLANMKIGPNNLDFLIQRNWVNNNGGYCSSSLN